ncbi:MAG: methyltransferase domain-containing protein [Hyphomicrobiales bacterium]|jgi:SAM-dependent methyltransferase|nr:methyltransferase domain-containing protein [Hyphomicrobiales bacterium]
MSTVLKNNKKQLFDRNKLLRSRIRAKSVNLENKIYTQISNDISNRLSEINRLFDSVLIITKNRNFESFNIPIKDKSNPCILSPTYPFNFNNIIFEDEEMLPFNSNKFDLIISDLFLHTSNNLQESLKKIRDLLKPDGLMIATMFGSDTLFELKYSLISAEEKITGLTYPRVNPFIDIKNAGDILYSSGFKLCVADNYKVQLMHEHPLELIKLIRSMGENNYINLKKPPIKRKVWNMATHLLKEKSTNPNLIPSTFEIITLTGWKFHENQQKPLAPGSAKIYLKDVLKNSS